MAILWKEARPKLDALLRAPSNVRAVCDLDVSEGRGAWRLVATVDVQRGGVLHVEQAVSVARGIIQGESDFARVFNGPIVSRDTDAAEALCRYIETRFPNN